MRTYTIGVRENGSPRAGLTPAFVTFVRISDGATVAAPVITELEGGGYKFDYEATEGMFGVVDAGGVLANDAERYIFVELHPHDDLVESMYARVVENNRTFEEVLRFLISMFSVFTRSGNTATFRDMADSKNRVQTAQDSTGRTQVNILDLNP